MFTFGRCVRQSAPKMLKQALTLTLLAALSVGGGCNTLQDMYTTPTSQVVCSDYESGVKGCGGSFDYDSCISDLSCYLGLYRTEALDAMLSCVDRFNQNLCPTYTGYFCVDPQDVAARAAVLPTPAMTEYAQTFLTKQATCQSQGIAIDTWLYDQRLLMRDYLFQTCQPCLDLNCGDISLCLRVQRQYVEMNCP